MGEGVASVAAGDVARSDDADTKWSHGRRGYAIDGTARGAGARLAR
jgi:hypothetical protein